MAGLRRRLDVDRLDVASADDDQLLEPTRDKELLADLEREIPGPQERAVTAAGEVPAKRLDRRLRLVPVAVGNSGALKPQLADRSLGRRFAGLRIDDHRPLLGVQVADRRDPMAVRRLAGDAGAELPGLERPDSRAVAAPTSGHTAGRLGEAVGRLERAGVESAGGECLGETVEGRRSNLLAADERCAPARKVELGPILRGRPPDRELVGEVRAAGHRAGESRYRLEPPGRTGDEREGRHDHRPVPRVDGLEDRYEKPHVVEERRPADRHRVEIGLVARAKSGSLLGEV